MAQEAEAGGRSEMAAPAAAAAAAAAEQQQQQQQQQKSNQIVNKNRPKPEDMEMTGWIACFHAMDRKTIAGVSPIFPTGRLKLDWK